MRHLALLVLISTSVWAAEPAKEKPVINPAPSAQDWANLAKLPDWSGVWNPKLTDEDMQAKTNMPPWNEKAAALVRYQLAEEKAGRPPPLFVNCLIPHQRRGLFVPRRHVGLGLHVLVGDLGIPHAAPVGQLRKIGPVLRGRRRVDDRLFLCGLGSPDGSADQDQQGEVSHGLRILVEWHAG